MKAIKILSNSIINEYFLIFSLSILIPFSIHSIPWQGKVSLGAIVLAMFYAPMIAVLLSKYKLAIFVSLFSPLANFLITGHPIRASVVFLTLELVAFSLVFIFLDKKNKRLIFNPVIGYIVSIFIVFCIALLIPKIVLPRLPLEFLMGTLSNSFLGLAIMVFIGFVINRSQDA